MPYAGKQKQNIDFQIPFRKGSSSTAQIEDIMGQKNTESDASDLVWNEEKSFADNLLALLYLLILLAYLQKSTVAVNWRTGRWSWNRVRDLKGTLNVLL